ncbi:MAG: LysR family transcriptional regulator [Gemmatimonadales bacterium]|nr:LysR family transcriptional regulator [Gemmatimonadales bacterium]
MLRNLQYLAALVREKHFARAAAACDVSQPTLSAGIKQLEEQLGFLIVRRGQRFNGLTAEGERVLGWARRILADCESLEQDAGDLRAGLKGRLRIGAIPTTLPILSLLTLPFARAHPHVTVSVLSLTSAEIQRGIDDFDLDAGLTYLDNEPLTNVRAVPLYQERYFLFTPAGGRFTGRASVSWAEAAETPLCLLTPDMQNRRIVDANFAAAGVTVDPVIETNSVLTLWSHLASGVCSTVLPQTFLRLLGRVEGLAALPVERPTVTHTVGLVVPDREPLTPSARELSRIAAGVDVAAALERRAEIPG